ncbi:MAG: aspartate--tRNA ligase [Firmicutes bacterium]|nr:aspartate--tRNA ligase [Bacillota bacterium]
MYRTHKIDAITAKEIGKKIKVAGWIDGTRDHGGIAFVDLRDDTNTIIQVVFDEETSKNLPNRESVISVDGTLVNRAADVINKNLSTGKWEIKATGFEVLSKVLNPLPFEVSQSHEVREELRLKYRFLDLRNKIIRDKIILRNHVINFLRQKMISLGFMEFQTPILTASSPEGARDFLVPSRKHKGKFYALPQAPQQFKQLLMASGFSRYFQIAPCFRDEDARADRTPGEFYQLDFEMAFATQEDVFKVVEDVMYDTFTKFSNKKVSAKPFRHITFNDAMMLYGSDKPDLRNPLIIADLTSFFSDCDFAAFKGKQVRGIVVNSAECGRSFIDKLTEYALSIGMKGLGYVTIGEEGELKGPIAKFIKAEKQKELITKLKLKKGSTLFFISDDIKFVNKFAGLIRTELGKRLNIIDTNKFEFCFVVDFPMYEENEETGKIDFTHNPFSMPQGGMEALQTKNPLDILAYQYDIVCNGIELTSGAVRNHRPDIMVKAFEIAGYTKAHLEEKFAALYNAFHYGVPPHAGSAPGIDRMVMLLSDEENVREVIAFPLNSNGQDPLLNAPSTVDEQQLRDIHIKLR